jgi:hypothetical protein
MLTGLIKVMIAREKIPNKKYFDLNDLKNCRKQKTNKLTKANENM